MSYRNIFIDHIPWLFLFVLTHYQPSSDYFLWFFVFTFIRIYYSDVFVSFLRVKIY